MRMGTFLLGGIVGAVAVVYFNRNNRTLMSNISQAGQTVGNMMNKARNSISNMDMMTNSSNKGMNSTASGSNTNTSGMNANSSNQNANSSNQNANSSNQNANSSNQNANSSNQNANSGMSTASANLSKVEEIVKKDPDLKTKVDEILNENKQSTSAYGLQ